MEAMGLLSYLHTLHDRRFPVNGDLKELVEASAGVFSEEFHIQDGSRILERVTFNPGVIVGGEKVNIIARHCSLGLEMRIPWGCSAYDIFDEISKKESSAEIKPLEICNPGLTEPNEKIVKTACRNIKKVYKKDSFPILQWAASDARYLREKSFRVIEYGPGDLKTIHGINEKVSIKNLNKSVEIYAGILKDYDS